MRTPFIHASGIEKVFSRGSVTTPALRGAHISVQRSTFTVIAGASGSGKTTLLSVIGGLTAMDAGSLTVDGLDVAVMDEDARALFRRESVGFVFQGNNLVPTFTVLENVMLPAQLNDMNDAEYRARAIIEKVGLGGREGAFAVELSGGEAQRIAIARALVHEPAVVLADEPTANLDSKTAMLVMDVFDALHESTGATILLATHDEAVMGRGYDRRTMKDGVFLSGVDGKQG